MKRKNSKCILEVGANIKKRVLRCRSLEILGVNTCLTSDREVTRYPVRDVGTAGSIALGTNDVTEAARVVARFGQRLGEKG